MVNDEFSDLPPPDTVRWVARRKAAVVEAVRRGRMTVDMACKRWNLTAEELASWSSAVDRHGLTGLKTTRIQQFRRG